MAEIQIFAEGKTNKTENKADIKPLVNAYNEYKNVNNKDGAYNGPRYRDFLLSMGDGAKLLSKPDTATEEEIKAAAEKIINCAALLKTEPEEIPETETENQTE